MSLQQRLKKIEDRLTALESLATDIAQDQLAIVNQLGDEAEEEEQSGTTLDGDEAGRERDQSQPL